MPVQVGFDEPRHCADSDVDKLNLMFYKLPMQGSMVFLRHALFHKK